MSSQFDRRKFLKNSLLTLPTVGFLEQLMMMTVEGLVNQALAETLSSDKPRNYVQLHLDNGWNRTSFDAILALSADDLANRFVRNPFMGTAFTTDSSNNVTALEYKTFSYKGVQAPWLWQFDVSKKGGGRRPMSELLDHMAVIRGFSSGIDGHEFNRLRVTYPEPQGVSIGGAVADQSASLMAAVVHRSANWFRSKNGIGATPVSIGNMSFNSISDIRKSFDFTSVASKAPLVKKAQYQQVIEKATNAIKKIRQGDGNYSENLKKNLANAESVVNAAAEDLSSIWNTLASKYKTIIENSVNPSILYPSGIPGITDKVLLTPSVANPSLFRFSGGLSGVTSNYIPEQGIDFRVPFTQAFDGTHPITLANLWSHFALIEYCLTRGSTQSIMTNIAGNSLQNLNFNNINMYNGGADNTAFSTLPSPVKSYGIYNSDEHYGGAYASLMCQVLTYRGLSAGLLELVDVLKASTVDGKNLFDETVIHLTSDFNRSPRRDGTGSDHGYWAHHTSVISGAFSGNGPVVTGNILVKNAGPRGTDNVTSGSSFGTWGAAAPVRFGSEKETVMLKHVTASIAHLLRLEPNPWPFNNRVWSLKGSILTPVSQKNILSQEEV
ncbi:MAG: hypothetical protein L6Q37_02970 [Bdellovibrionaceae bacterium]|nr:hypothetical protein [Pseudobdellovibrionaceae bacterium]NUM59510.1 hypothetical protein [Pseudobdellovibrionaceae bacterium]